MLGWWKKQSKARTFVLLGAVAFAVFIGVGNYSGSVKRTKRAKTMSANGVAVSAVPVRTLEESKSRGPFTSHTFSVDYDFADAAGQIWQGSAELTQEEFAQLVDKADKKGIRADARLSVVYNKADPRENGLKRLFEPQPEPNLARSLGGAFIGVGIALVLLTWPWRFAYGPRKPT